MSVKGDNQRCEQGEKNGDCHRLEELAFGSAQRQDWKIDDNDDGDAKEDRPSHLLAGGFYRVFKRVPPVSARGDDAGYSR